MHVTTPHDPSPEIIGHHTYCHANVCAYLTWLSSTVFVCMYICYFLIKHQRPAALGRLPSLDVGLDGDLSPEISLGGDLSPEISSITKATGALALDADETVKVTVGEDPSVHCFLPHILV